MLKTYKVTFAQPGAESWDKPFYSIDIVEESFQKAYQFAKDVVESGEFKTFTEILSIEKI